MLTYCFESAYVARTIARCRKNDLAVVDTEGYESYVRQAVSRGVWVYGYLNIGALEKQRPYYNKLKHIGLARYDGWVILWSGRNSHPDSRRGRNTY